MAEQINLRFYRADGPYNVLRTNTVMTRTKLIDATVEEEQAKGATFLGVVAPDGSGQLQMPLRYSGWRFVADRNDLAHIILENSEGGQALFVQVVGAEEVIVFRDRTYTLAQRLTPTEATKFKRRWQGISPDADDEVGLDMAHEQEAPPPPPEDEGPDEYTLDAKAQEMAERAGIPWLTATVEQKELFVKQAQKRLAAEGRAVSLPVPAMHDETREVPILVRDPESGELNVTHEYHNLHAPEGELVTSEADEREVRELTRVVAGYAFEGLRPTQALSRLGPYIKPGRSYPWRGMARLAGAEVETLASGPTWRGKDLKMEKAWAAVILSALEDVERGGTDPVVLHAVELLDLQRVHLASPREGEMLQTFCHETDPENEGSLLWILPARFKQCGPVPFGPMCQECVVALEGMKDDDPRLVPPEQRPEPKGRFMVEVFPSIPVDVAQYSEFAVGAQRAYFDGKALTRNGYFDLLAAGDDYNERLTYSETSNKDLEIVSWVVYGVVKPDADPVQDVEAMATLCVFPHGMRDSARRGRFLLAQYRAVYDEVVKGHGDPLSEDNIRRAVRKVNDDVEAEDEFVARIKGLKPSDVPEAWSGGGVSWVESLDPPDRGLGLLPPETRASLDKLLNNDWAVSDASPLDDMREADRIRKEQEARGYGPPPIYWVGYNEADPIYDLVIALMAEKNFPVTLGFIRGTLRAFVERNTLDYKKWPDERIPTEAKRIYNKWATAQNTNSKEAVNDDENTASRASGDVDAPPPDDNGR
jgi:hypothetical protein